MKKFLLKVTSVLLLFFACKEPAPENISEIKSTKTTLSALTGKSESTFPLSVLSADQSLIDSKKWKAPKITEIGDGNGLRIIGTDLMKAKEDGYLQNGDIYVNFGPVEASNPAQNKVLQGMGHTGIIHIDENGKGCIVESPIWNKKCQFGWIINTPELEMGVHIFRLLDSSIVESGSKLAKDWMLKNSKNGNDAYDWRLDTQYLNKGIAKNTQKSEKLIKEMSEGKGTYYCSELVYVAYSLQKGSPLFATQTTADAIKAANQLYGLKDEDYMSSLVGSNEGLALVESPNNYGEGYEEFSTPSYEVHSFVFLQAWEGLAKFLINKESWNIGDKAFYEIWKLFFGAKGKIVFPHHFAIEARRVGSKQLVYIGTILK